MWDHPGPGIEPKSPSLAGGFFTTEPPGKPYFIYFLKITLILKIFKLHLDFPSGPGVKNLPANAGDVGSISGLGKSHMPRSN